MAVRSPMAIAPSTAGTATRLGATDIHDSAITRCTYLSSSHERSPPHRLAPTSVRGDTDCPALIAPAIEGRPRWPSHGDGRGVPGGPLGVRLDDVGKVDVEIVAFAADGEAVHVPRRAARHEGAVGLVLRLVLRALEPVVLRQPLQRGVLVRTRQVERVDMTLRPHDDDLLLAIDGDAVGGWKGILLRAGRLDAVDEYHG